MTSEQLVMLAYLAGALIGWVLRGCVAREKKQMNGYQPKERHSEKALKNPPKYGSMQTDE